jgi:hypothetical protein
MDHLKDNLLKSINQELSKESNKVIQEINELVIFNSGGGFLGMRIMRHPFIEEMSRLP